MRTYEWGTHRALAVLGIEKVALRRVPRVDSDVEDADLTESVRRDLLMQHIEAMKAHQLAPMSEYERAGERGAGGTGAFLGAVPGAYLGAMAGGALAKGSPTAMLAGTLAGTALGGLGGYHLGKATGRASGRSDYRSDKADMDHTLGLESKPHGIDRELAAHVRAAKERAIADQRDHDREIAHMNQRRINYNVDAGQGSPLRSYGRLGGGWDTFQGY
jgi:hypothetical protein